MSSSKVNVPKHAGPPRPGSAAKRDDKRVHLLVRLYGGIMFLGGVLSVLLSALLGGVLGLAMTLDPESVTIGGEMTSLSLVLMAASVILALVDGVLSVIVGKALFKSDRRRVGLVAPKLLIVMIVEVMVTIMLDGIESELLFYGVQIATLIALSVTIDPRLARERKVERAIERMENAEDVMAGMEGRDRSGKGYIELNFFNLFWEFVVCCVLGLILEIIWHMVVVEPGVYQDRAGLLFGPFSPIYGFGAVLVTLALNRLYDKNLVLVFLVSAVVGGTFEAAVSVFMQLGFGATAWDYSSYTILGVPDPVAVISGGRTSTMFLGIWGVLGLVWVKAFLPLLLKFINLIPWKLRYGITAVCTVLMLVNGVMTLESLDCWFERVSGIEPITAAGQFYAEYFDNEYMQNRFQSMTIEPEDSTRLADAATGR